MVNGKTIEKMDKEHISLLMAAFLKANSKMIKDTVRGPLQQKIIMTKFKVVGTKIILMDLFTIKMQIIDLKDTLARGKKMVREYFTMKMVINIKEIG